MKNFIILYTMIFSLSAGASDLIILNRDSGFEPNLKNTKVSVSESGEIVRVITIKSKVAKETLGQLSTITLQSLKSRIIGIDESAILVDPTPAAPRCEGGVSSSVTINKDGKEIVVGEDSSCHALVLQDSSARALVNAINGMYFL